MESCEFAAELARSTAQARNRSGDALGSVLFRSGGVEVDPVADSVHRRAGRRRPHDRSFAAERVIDQL